MEKPARQTSENAYKLLDCGNFMKLEQVGPWRIARPAAQAVWRPRLPESDWRRVDASFERFKGGDGKWTVHNRKLPANWLLPCGPVTLNVKLTDFGHLGIFAEQDRNWPRLVELVEDGIRKGKRDAAKPFQVLNLFAYTGGSSLACARGGAHVVHVDASKTSVAWARENAEVSKLSDHPIRWIVDDVRKFVQREVRRGSRYHGIILDPPTYGRGAKGEIWQIEEHLPPLLDDLEQILAEDFTFVMLCAHSNGYTPLALKNLVQDMLKGRKNLRCEHFAEEMVIEESQSVPPRMLPSGAMCLTVSK
ncbi:MAG: hypothetical protein RIQ81_854 [Pseudomonadota bacterium]